MNLRPLAALEWKLWEAADKLRGTIDGTAYREIVLGILFLRIAGDPARSRAGAVLVLPPEASFSTLFAARKRANFGTSVDAAFSRIGLANPEFAGVFPSGFSGLDPERLAALFELFAEIPSELEGDVLGGVYEYFLGAFALAEGRRGGEFFTPPSLAKLLVTLLDVREGTVFDPAVGAGGIFVEIVRRAARGQAEAPRFVGQESNERTYRLCKMNLALAGHRVELGPRASDSLGADLHPELRADFVVMNPPFNVGGWGAAKLSTDPRFGFGAPPEKSANFAWIQHALARLAPSGRVGIFLSNGSLSSKLRAEATIRRRLVEAGRVEAILQLPSQLFSNTQIATCLWLLRGESAARESARRDEVLFIDAERLGRFVTRARKELSDEEILRIAQVHGQFRESKAEVDEPGFARSVSRKTIAEEDFVLTPGRYVGSRSDHEEALPKLETLAERYLSATRRGHELDDEIESFLKGGKFAGERE